MQRIRPLQVCERGITALSDITMETSKGGDDWAVFRLQVNYIQTRFVSNQILASVQMGFVGAGLVHQVHLVS